MNDSNIIRDIGRSFIVSSFIPAALFITLSTLIFQDFAPAFLSKRIVPNDQLFAGQWALILLLVFWIGFGLYSSWNWTVKLFEGYYFPRWIANRLSDRLFEEKESRSAIINEVHNLVKMERDPNDVESNRINELFSSALEDYQSIETIFPMEKDHFLPTRLGNVLRTSEIYSWKRYRMEGVTLFSRLVHLFPPVFANQIEEQNNKFIFLLNSAFLSIIIGMICVVVVILRIPCFLLHPIIMENGLKFYSRFACTANNDPSNFFQAGFESFSEGKYFLLGLLFLLGGYIIYRGAVIAAMAYARLIRTGFDLYRFDLLEKLHIDHERFIDLNDERATWRMVSKLLIAGEDLGITNIQYKKEDSPDNEPSITTDHSVGFQMKPIRLTIQSVKRERKLSSDPED